MTESYRTGRLMLSVVVREPTTRGGSSAVAGKCSRDPTTRSGEHQLI